MPSTFYATPPREPQGENFRQRVLDLLSLLRAKYEDERAKQMRNAVLLSEEPGRLRKICQQEAQDIHALLHFIGDLTDEVKKLA